MATWEDGPEYAPLERPDEFADPSAATVGLAAPPQVPPPPPAPTERPVFDDPGRPVPSLASLVPAPPAERDPQLPFDVATSLVTAESSAWASTHWAGPPSPGQPPAAPVATGPTAVPYGQHPGNGQHPGSTVGNGQHPPTPAGPVPVGYPPPEPSTLYGQGAYGQVPDGPTTWPGHPTAGSSGQPYPPPGQPFPPAQPGANGPFPAPGTPQWFSPGGYPPAMPPTPPPNARTVLTAVTPGVGIGLVIGGFIATLAPVTLVVAFLLSSRMTYGRKATRTAFAAVLAFLGLVGLLSLITADGAFSQWWDTVAAWACFGSWVMIVAATVAAYRALKQGRPDPPPTPRR